MDEGKTVRCPRCGNENPETNRFCGMCGTTLLEAAPVAPGPAVSGASHPVTAPASLGAPAPAPAAPRAAPSSGEPLISGPSFLGLDKPAPATGARRASLSINPDAHENSRNLDYLLEDENEPKRGGGKVLLILAALALALVFGYLRWRNQGLGGLSSSKAPATAQSSDGADTSAPAANQPAAGTASQTTADSASSSTKAAGDGTAAPAGERAANPAAATQPDTSKDKDKDAAGGAPDAAAPAATAKPPAPVPADTASSGPTSHAASHPPTASHSAPKPRPTVSAARPAFDPVAEAEKSIYGRGVRQDCDRGLRLLKPAAEQGNPKAMIQMGALYSAGLCTPHDLPTAYRWFALALRKQPDNQAVQADLQKLWSEMTQPERQLAIRLSQ